MSKASSYFIVDKLDDKHDLKKIKHEIGQIRGVILVSVNTLKDSIAVDYDTTGTEHKKLEKEIEAMGFPIVNAKFENHIM